MATITITASVNMANVSFANFDDLVINNGALVTVNTPQVKCWKTIAINNGNLFIQNTSSTVPIRFTTGRSSGATANTITPASGLGTVEITGSWIYMNNGSGIQYQSLNCPYEDYVPAIWVETSSGSNDFEPWMNVTTQVGEAQQFFRKDLEFAWTGSAGKFFRQASISEPYSTLFTGSISSSISSSLRSGFKLTYTSSLFCGDSIGNGNVFPSESRIRIPNIMITDDTPLNAQTATSATSCNFVYTAGGVFKCNTALIDESYANFTQAQICEMRNMAWSEYPTISECYSLVIDNVAFASHPVRRYFVSTTGWTTRDQRWGGTQGGIIWSYINNAYINRMYVANFGRVALASNQNTATAALFTGTVYINNATNLSVTNLKTFNFFNPKNFDYGLALNFVNDSTFTNVEMYGGEAYNIQNSIGNTFTATTHSQGYNGESYGFTSNWRRGIDPLTNAPYVLGQPYWYKFRSFRNTQDTSSINNNFLYYYQTGSEYVDSRPFSATPYTASGADAINHPDYFGVFPTNTGTVFAPTSASLVWIRRDPSVGYLVFRQTASFTNTASAQLVYTSSTVATVTFTDTGSLLGSGGFVPSQSYYYVLRKLSTQVGSTYTFSDSAPQIFLPLAAPTASNLILQSSVFDSATWFKSGVTVAAGARICPNDVLIATAAALSGDQLLYTSATGFVSQSISVTANIPYVFSVYLAALTSSVSMSLSASIGPSNRYSASYTVDQRWTRATLFFTPTISSTTASVGIYGNSILPVNTKVWAAMAQLNTGSVAHPHITTTTTATVQSVADQMPTSLRTWSSGPQGSGTEILFGALVASSHHWELHSGTASNFVPDKNTLIADSHIRGIAGSMYLLNAASNVFNGFKQPHKNTGFGQQFLTLLNASSNNRFLNFNLDYNYMATNLINVSVLSNNNFVHNWNIGGFRNYVSTNYLVTGVNNAQGLIMQNVYAHTADIPLCNALTAPLGVELKNVSAANARAASAATTYVLGSTTDSVGIAYTTVYDIIFNQFDWRNNTGSLHLCFNASSKSPLPYTTTGSVLFANTGRLYFLETGSSITYTWPYKIYGVTGFLPNILSAGNFNINTPLSNGSELGTQVTTSYSLLKEVSINTGTGYGNWIEIGPSLTGSTYDPVAGFNMRVKLTANPGLKYSGQTKNFTSSIWITGSITNAIALVVSDEDLGATGTLIIRNITGSFSGSEVLNSSGVPYATCSQTAGTSRGILPNATSYIDGLQIFTTTSTSSFYPISQPTITLTGITSGSKVDIIRASDSAILDAQYVTTNPTGDYTYTYDYYQNTPVYLVINNLGYVFQSISYTLTSVSAEVPIQQTIDRNYSNAPGGP